MVGIDALLPEGASLHAPTVRGLLVGLAGTVMLVAPSAWQALTAVERGRRERIMVVADFCYYNSAARPGLWAQSCNASSMRARIPLLAARSSNWRPAWRWSIPALLTPHAVALDCPGGLAIAYLIVFGGIVGYSAFLLAISRLPVAIASIYTYMNPVVAVLLGWLFYREPFGLWEACAMLVIFCGVAMVRRATSVPVQKLRADRATESR